jgi:hypothetical protein
VEEVVTFRVELSSAAKAGLDDFTDRAGMTQFATLSRLVEWFVSLPDDVRLDLLRRPADRDDRVREVVLTRLAGTALSPQAGRPKRDRR